MSDFFNAVNRGDLNSVREFLEQGVDPNQIQKNDFGNTPLNIASANSDYKMVKLLLEFGAEKTIGENDEGNGSTPLHYVCCHGNIKLVKLIVENGGRKFINKRDHHGGVPLLSAAFYGYTEIVRYLLENGAAESVNYQDNYGNTSLHEASRYYIPGSGLGYFPSRCDERIETSKVLLAYGADYTILNENGYDGFYHWDDDRKKQLIDEYNCTGDLMFVKSVSL